MKKSKIILLIFSLIFYQCFIYFITKFTPFEFNVLVSSIDSRIPFVSIFVYFYIGWYLMLFFVPFIFYKHDELNFNKYILATFISITVCGIIYFCFPTLIIREPIAVNNITTFLIDLIYKLDTPALNCLPSMHCLISFLFMIYSTLSKKLPTQYKCFINVFSILVVVSTVLIKQHFIIDVVTALIISIIISVIVNKKIKTVFIKI